MAIEKVVKLPEPMLCDKCTYWNIPNRAKKSFWNIFNNCVSSELSVDLFVGLSARLYLKINDMQLI